MREVNRVVFVSGHGVCRAPMAAAILRSKKPKGVIEILARGRDVSFPEPINQKMEAVMTGKDVSCEGMVAVQFTNEDVTDSTIVFTFDSKQKDQLIEGFEACSVENTFVLSTYLGEELEIMNPYGGTLQAYGLCFEMMNNTITKLAGLFDEDKVSLA